MNFKALEEALKYAVVTVLLANVGAFLFSIPLGYYLMVTISEGIEYARGTTTPYFLLLLTAMRLPFSIEIGWLLILLLVFYSLCFLISYFINENLSSVISNLRTREWKDIFSNWLLSMPIISSLLLLTVILLQYVQETHIGVPTGSIEFDNPFDGLISLAYSPLVEEVGFRIIPIGFILLVYMYRLSRRMGEKRPLKFYLTTWLFPEKGKKTVGVKTMSNNGLKGITSYEWFMIIVTSLVFGLAHYLFGGGWDVGKISSAFTAGFVLALVFSYYGAPAAILTHWYFNYYGYAYELAQDYYPEVFKPVLSTIDIITIAAAFIGLGIFFLSIYRTRLISKRVNSHDF